MPIWLRGAITTIMTWLVLNKDKIQAIVLRIQKDAKDGWTNEEKEQLAVDLFFQEVYPLIPWFLKFIPKVLIETSVRALIRMLCAKAKIYKGKAKKLLKTK